MRSFSFSSPGKVLWIGSYTVVFGGISHSVAIDRRVRCTLTEGKKNVFDTSYGKFREGENPVIDSVLSVVREHLGDVKGVQVSLKNDEDFSFMGRKTGLGSSSASTVSLTGCLYYYMRERIDLDEIHFLSQKANYVRQGGIGSGFDIATAVYGSVKYRRFTTPDSRDWNVEKVEFPTGYEILLGFTGRSADTVNLVREFSKAKDTDYFRESFREIEKENEMAVKYLEKGDLISAIPHVKMARTELNLLAEKVGVKLESQQERKILRETEKRGALIAFSPGAGGGDSLLAIGKEMEQVKSFWESVGIKVIKVKEDRGLTKDA
ncbi:phosphomevalonate kinase [Sulfuracidifex tepidarius]|uniref:phosphomevalonate kinase n=1 Tax=Sulfuracidifex tepidarius TaxID=1294262 RepID=A0A510DZ34_9CREN|nr:phosphomevalonate kinase [Sulfuracidifex tepidarius]BBG25220.1 Phosphomevalonate kinase [Sulfuracidifex tepidarius]BBG28014.1 Phosphomevalonate kinase [Sulfuracidifex tepidarius]